MEPAVHAIWAQSREGVIGSEGRLPWHVPEDLAHFKSLTKGDAVVMGRRTWESLGCKPLPDRENFVLTTSSAYLAAGATVVNSFPDAIAKTAAKTLWAIGGTNVYEAALQYASRLEVTDIDISCVGDARAPFLDDGWKQSKVTDWQVSVSGERYRFRTLYKGVRLLERLHALRDEVRAQNNGRIFTPAEVLSLAQDDKIS